MKHFLSAFGGNVLKAEYTITDAHTKSVFFLFFLCLAQCGFTWDEAPVVNISVCPFVSLSIRPFRQTVVAYNRYITSTSETNQSPSSADTDYMGRKRYSGDENDVNESLKLVKPGVRDKGQRVLLYLQNPPLTQFASTRTKAVRSKYAQIACYHTSLVISVRHVHIWKFSFNTDN